MKKHLITLFVAALVVAGVASCGSDDSEKPTAAPAKVTTTVTQPAPPPVTVTAKPKPAPAPDSDVVLAEAALSMTWSDMSASDQRAICEGWGMSGMKDYFLDIFMDSSGNQFDRDVVEAFFDRQC